jgi:hypothetical protein
MQVGRNLLFTDGDKMAADVQKMLEAADRKDFSREGNALEADLQPVLYFHVVFTLPAAIPPASAP